MKRLHRTRAFTLVELLVVIGIIALLISILLPSLNRARETANRVKCAANLKSIGTAILLYANENHGAFPRTVGGQSAPWNPTWGSTAASTNPFTPSASATPGTRPYNNDVSASMYLLLTTEDITGASFVCPSSNATQWDFGGGSNVAQCWSNWNGSGELLSHVSYSIQEPWSDDNGTGNGFKFNNSATSDFALMADINPGIPSVKDNVGSGGGGANDNVMQVTTSSTGNALKAGNSSNHDKDGQNVLFCDGHVDFQQTCLCGSGADNIYCRATSSGSADQNDPFFPSYNGKDNVLLPND